MKPLNSVSWLAFSFPSWSHSTVQGEAPAPLAGLFGEYTLIGGGGITTTAPNAVYGELTVAGGVLSPNTTPLTVGTQDVDGTTYTIVANTAHCLETEIAACVDGVNGAVTNIKVRDTNTSPSDVSVRHTPAARAFAQEVILEAENWTATPGRPDLLVSGTLTTGILFQRNTSNITVQGFEAYHYSTDNQGVFEISVTGSSSPTTNMKFYDNHIHSKSQFTEWDEGNFGDGDCFGIYINGSMTAQNSGAMVERNYCHDLQRGLAMYGLTGTSGDHVRVCDNVLELCRQNFTDTHSATYLDMFDNTGLHILASNIDGSPHAAAGGSFSPPMANCRVMGNFWHRGFARNNWEFAKNGVQVTLAATGEKWNDPTSFDSYQNCEVAFETLCTGDITLQCSGLNFNVHHNSLHPDSFNVLNSESTNLYQTANTNLNIWANVSSTATIHSGGATDTRLTWEGYANHTIESGTDIGRAYEYVAGHPSKGLVDLLWHELRAAFTPKAGHYTITADMPRGSLGTGLYSGNGVHTAGTFAVPKADAGTAYNHPTTVWDGTAYMQGSIAKSSEDGKRIALAFKGSFHADTDAANAYLISCVNSDLTFLKTSADRMEVRAKNAASSIILDSTSTFTVDSSDGDVVITFEADLETGVATWTKNGIIDPISETVQINNDVMAFDSGLWRCFSNRFTTASSLFKGDFDLLYMGDTLVGLDTTAGLNKMLSADQGLMDFGSDGSTVTGTAARIFLRGNAATIGAGNAGAGGTLTLNGSITDDAGAPVGLYPDPGFDNPSAWSVPARISGSEFVFDATNLAGYNQRSANGFHAPVVAGETYELTTTWRVTQAGLYRFEIDWLDASNVKIGDSGRIPASTVSITADGDYGPYNTGVVPVGAVWAQWHGENIDGNIRGGVTDILLEIV